MKAMTIYVGSAEYSIESAELRYTCHPNATLTFTLEIESRGSDGSHGPFLTLTPPPIEARALAELNGRVLSIQSPWRPDPVMPNTLNVVAGIYMYEHGEVHDSRMEWGDFDGQRIGLRWIGMVEDPDVYDGTSPRQLLQVEAFANAVSEPHEFVRWRVTRSENDENEVLQSLQEEILKELAHDLTERNWFAGLPFASVELIVEVPNRKAAWPKPLANAPNEAQLVVIRVPRKTVLSNDKLAIRKAFKAQFASALAHLEKSYR